MEICITEILKQRKLWCVNLICHFLNYPNVFCQRGFFEIFSKFTRMHPYRILFFNKVAGWSLQNVFSSEFCKICRSTFLTEQLRATVALTFMSSFFYVCLLFYNFFRKGHVPAQMLSVIYGSVQFLTYESTKNIYKKYVPKTSESQKFEPG